MEKKEKTIFSYREIKSITIEFSDNDLKNNDGILIIQLKNGDEYRFPKAWFAGDLSLSKQEVEHRTWPVDEPRATTYHVVEMIIKSDFFGHALPDENGILGTFTKNVSSEPEKTEKAKEMMINTKFFSV